MKTLKGPVTAVLLLLIAGPVLSQNITYSQHVRPLWEEMCERCHGSAAPTYEAFVKDRDNPAVNFDGKGPRMDSYEGMLFFVTGPQAGALMRMLDDGTHTADKQAGPMYRHLGRQAQRKQNLMVFKQWVGEDAWIVRKAGELTPDDLKKIRAVN